MFQCRNPPFGITLTRTAARQRKAPMKQRKSAAVRRRSKPVNPQSDRQKQQNDSGAESLLKEVAQANANVTNPEERERVIPSRPC